MSCLSGAGEFVVINSTGSPVMGFSSMAVAALEFGINTMLIILFFRCIKDEVKVTIKKCGLEEVHTVWWTIQLIFRFHLTYLLRGLSKAVDLAS